VSNVDKITEKEEDKKEEAKSKSQSRKSHSSDTDSADTSSFKSASDIANKGNIHSFVLSLSSKIK